MGWKFKIELKDIKVFKEIEETRKITISKSFIDFIVERNAATPEKYHFLVSNTERIFGAVLSFNKNEKGVDSVYTALEVIKDENLLPFGIDPFGNYICLDLLKNEVVFYDHETNSVEEVKKSLESFVNELY